MAFFLQNNGLKVVGTSVRPWSLTHASLCRCERGRKLLSRLLRSTLGLLRLQGGVVLLERHRWRSLSLGSDGEGHFFLSLFTSENAVALVLSDLRLDNFIFLHNPPLFNDCFIPLHEVLDVRVSSGVSWKANNFGLGLERALADFYAFAALLR